MTSNIIQRIQTSFLLSALAIISFVACSSDDETFVAEVKIPTDLVANGMTFGNSGGSANFSIEANVEVEVKSSQAWCKVTRAGGTTFTVVVEPNTEASPREAIVTVTAENVEKGRFSVEQDAVEAKVSIPEDLTRNGLAFAKEGGTETVSIESNVTVTLESSMNSWCSVTPEGNQGNAYKFTIKAAPNTKTEDREATITVKAGTMEQGKFSVKQIAAEGLTVGTKVFEGVAAAGGEISVAFSTNAEYSVGVSDDWISEVPATRASMEEKTKTFKIAANTGKWRIGTITFTLGSIEEKVIVSQLAGSTSGELTANDGWSMAEQLGLGWNLGNQLDAHNSGNPDETCWGNPKTTQALFDKLVVAGFSSVRIPVTWINKIGAAPDYTIDQAWMDRVAEVVGYAERAGLKAIINLHHDGADSAYWLDIKNAAKSEAKNTQVKEQLAAVWTQIAERFKDKGSFLIFESMNEIQDGGWGWGENRTDDGKQYATMNEWNQLFVDVVRATGGNNATRYLGIPSYNTNIDFAADNTIFRLPADQVPNRLLVAVHCYDPYTYTLNDEYSEWGHTGAAGKKESWGDEESLKSSFEKMKTTFVDQGIPVYIGEFGCIHRSTSRAESFRKYYLEYFCKAAKEYGMAAFYWDNGTDGTGKENSGLFNHSDGTYLNNGQEVVMVMAKAVNLEAADYTLQSVYDSAPE